MNFRLILAACLVLGLAAPSCDLHAWGSGHDDIVRALLERIPAEIRSTFGPELEREAILHASHYPDSFEPILAEEVGEAGLARLSAAGLKRRFDLHSERGMALAFIELAEALRERHPARTAHWLAAYSHVVADMSACNHDPLVHTATYGWADWKLKLPGGKETFASLKSLLDLAGTARDPEGGSAAFAEAIERHSLADDGRDAASALVEVMLYGQEGAAFCSVHGVGILDGAVGWTDRKDEAARQRLWHHMGELGAWAVARTLRDFSVARRLAESEATLSLTPEIESAWREGVARHLAGHDLADEALFAPILRSPAEAGNGAVGVVCEPTWAMNGAMMGFASRVASVSLARGIASTGRPVATLDLRPLLADGFPSPASVPLVVVVANSFNSYHQLKADDFDRQLSAYLEAGGRVLWVGGTSQPPAKSLGAFKKAMVPPAPKARLPVDDEQFLGSSLELADAGAGPWRIVHPATTAAGWQQPYCPHIFDLAGHHGLEALLRLRSGDNALTVGAVSRQGNAAFLPIYALTSHLLEGSDRVESPAEPSLDGACLEILETVLARLLPARKAEESPLPLRRRR